MNYFTLLLITVIVLGFAASTVGRKYVVRTDRLHSFWRFLVLSLIASLAVSALGYLFKFEIATRWQVWSSLIGSGFLIVAVLRLAQSVVDFDLLPSEATPQAPGATPRQEAELKPLGGDERDS